jgi:predicted  nucleic acid-binding Zn-ribbon protein
MNDPTELRRIYLHRLYGNDHKFGCGAPDMWNNETFNMYNEIELEQERFLTMSNMQKMQKRIQKINDDIEKVQKKETGDRLNKQLQFLNDQLLDMKATLAEMQKRRLALAMLSSPLAPEHSSYAHIPPELLENIAKYADI